MEARIRLMSEEMLDELFPAMRRGDMVEVADGIIDALYTIIGTARVYGLDLIPLWDEIHTTNMAKIETSAYKIAKPMGWAAPNLRSILLEQGWEEPIDITPTPQDDDPA